MKVSFPDLIPYGWDDSFAGHFAPYAAAEFTPGRVILEYNQFYRVVTSAGELLAETTGKMRYDAENRAALPAVGDWVVLNQRADQARARIRAILPRRSQFTRKTVGAKTEEQVVGANIDTVLLVTALNQDFNPRRIERLLSVALESGAQPVIILSKADACADVESKLAEMRAVAPETPLHAIAAKPKTGVQLGLDVVRQYLGTGQTVAIIGMSGVGKSSLVNALLGSDRQKVLEVREHDDRGQHATRHRELVRLPEGGLLLDTPGMREMQLWEAEDGVGNVFHDIELLIAQCRFSNCKHEGEPGCAIRAALAQGTLDAGRLSSYQKLQDEMAQLAQRQQNYAQLKEQRQKLKKLTKAAETRSKFKRDER